MPSDAATATTEILEEPETDAVEPGEPADPADSADSADASGEPVEGLPEGPTPATPGDELPEGGDEAQPGPGELLTDEELLQGVTALVFASPDPLSEKRLAALLEGPSIARVRAALETVRERLEASGLPLELRRIAGGVQILTAARLGAVVQRLFKARKAERVSAAALETLAVIAYRQPVTKAEIEAIRGVQAGPILRSLIDRGLVKVAGRADVPGHPLQYGTTREFLDRFGLGELGELPRDSELTKD
jgi:segregation and condensation protein B